MHSAFSWYSSCRGPWRGFEGPWKFCFSFPLRGLFLETRALSLRRTDRLEAHLVFRCRETEKSCGKVQPRRGTRMIEDGILRPNEDALSINVTGIHPRKNMGSEMARERVKRPTATCTESTTKTPKLNRFLLKLVQSSHAAFHSQMPKHT